MNNLHKHKWKIFWSVIFRSLINYLSNFNESYKNLSGLIPDKKQFGRFDEKSYNLGRCGPTINKSCTRTEENLAITSNRGEDEDESAIKMNPLVELVLAVATVFFHWCMHWLLFILACEICIFHPWSCLAMVYRYPSFMCNWTFMY